MKNQKATTMTKTPNLVTPKKAAEKVFVTRGMIFYWIRKGRVKKHYVLEHGYNYLVDLNEVIAATEGHKANAKNYPNLITVAEAAKLVFVSEPSIRYYVSRGYLQRHRVLENQKYYLVDKDEVLYVADTVEERSRGLLKNYAVKRPPTPRDIHGRFTSV